MSLCHSTDVSERFNISTLWLSLCYNVSVNACCFTYHLYSAARQIHFIGSSNSVWNLSEFESRWSVCVHQNVPESRTALPSTIEARPRLVCFHNRPFPHDPQVLQVLEFVIIYKGPFTNDFTLCESGWCDIVCDRDEGGNGTYWCSRSEMYPVGRDVSSCINDAHCRSCSVFASSQLN